MKFWNKSALIGMFAAMALGIAAGAVANVPDHPEDVVKYRKAVQQSLAVHMRLMKAVVRGKVSFTGHLADQARALQVSVKTLVDNLAVLFPAGTGADKLKTRAKPEIWRDWKKFEAGAGLLSRETAKLAEVAKGGDMKAFAAQYKAVGKACAACHKPFRAKKKRTKRKKRN